MDARVKPLVWAGRLADDPWGGYCITDALGPDGVWDWFSWSHSSRGDSDECDLAFSTEAEAKAAAQADYEARILAALEPAPDLAELVDAAVALSNAYRTWSLIPRRRPGEKQAFAQMHNCKVALDDALAKIKTATT